MALRPSQIRASAAESALMIPDAFLLRNQYADLKMPVVIIAGDQDRLIDIDTQSARLHSDVGQSRFHRVAGNGHMIQQTATDQVMAAIREVAVASTGVNAAAEIAGQQVEKATALANDVVEAASAEARKQGLTPDGAKAAANDLTGRVVDAAKYSVGEKQKQF